jgi:predicted metal-dependent HD superfamily phosphohydrolase
MPALERWHATWASLGCETSDPELYRRIIARYLEPGRSYHTVQHLDECFAWFDMVRHVAERPGEIELALWFHDAVYDVRGHDNEERSAAWAYDVAIDAGASTASAARARALVLATKHDAVPDDADAKLIVDVDLSILAAPDERFDEYERQVRQEYSWVPGFLFRRKRREILEGFLARPHIFNTDFFLANHEARARANLARSLASCQP